MATLGFVGLGAMGSRLARRLMAAGHQVVGYNRTPEKARDLVAAGLRLEKSPRAVTEASEAVFSMVTDNAALRAVALGSEGIVAGLKPGGVFVEMSTVSPAVVREIGEAVAARGAAMLDAPVSGSTITVEQGQASIQVGGDARALERVRPYLAAMGPGGITLVGPLGLAKTMKIATNLGLAVQMLAFSEAVLLAEKSGIARETAVEALMKSVVASPMVKYRGPFVLGQMPTDAWFNVAMIQKDLQLALDQGRAVGVPLPTTALTQEWLTMARGLGLGGYDFAIVFDVLASLSGASPSRKPNR
ncbi:MAG TPA: NAD(P)-dependent oxidoreductase [Methylomirabilota bacterium]|jgi:3-hydroxyisobutyrate dehydrogenase-like beta-hydroxyacid dehydrogenase|nr:NAD(P)-dependent oxidoreductase [Methylomirabilota bacterium]